MTYVYAFVTYLLAAWNSSLIWNWHKPLTPACYARITMKKALSGLLSLSLLLLAVTACSPRHSVILVPDPDGRVGKAEVITSGGKQLLERGGDMTQLSGPSAPPSAVTTADPGYIAATFAEALAVEPIPPEKFILFIETGSTALTPDSRASIATIVSACKRHGVTDIRISGHTDAAGSVRLNEKLAQERSAMVRELLRQNGISTELITATSHGKGNPLVPTPDGVAEPRNRRVEIIVR
jgi:outer membrane protein OmpA-like peptidoglycan-associated protein